MYLEAVPPSYEAAVTTAHLGWVTLAAPYVRAADYPNLCLVSRRFHDVFAPLLWRDPLVTIRKLGLDPADDLTWYFRFVRKRAPAARPSTRSHVLSLDFRQLARVSYHYRADRALTSTFAALPSLFPSLRCILLDGEAETEPRDLQNAPWHLLDEGGPVVLSLSGCQFLLGPALFATEGLRALTCLDVSGLPGSVRPLISAAHNLPRLRVLKAKRREIGAPDAADLAKAFAGMLWALDLSDNPLTDAALPPILDSLMPVASLRTGTHFEVEGTVEWRDRGMSSFGPFYQVLESSFSSTYSHPDRYLADSPSYDGGRQEAGSARTNGRTAVKDDSLDFAKGAVTADPEVSPAVAEAVLGANAEATPLSLSHLRLSNTKVTAPGMEALIRMSPGQLELVDCDTMRVPINTSWPPLWPKDAKLYGMLGSAYIWRPVLSSNLRSLRVHHSVVTQIPTLEAEGLSPLARLWLAETVVRERCELAYPQAFVPDMNPRITSLTLTKIPRRSSGPLINKITDFIRLASMQEREIADATVSSSRRAPMMLRGLRHLCLEFEPDPMEDLSQLTLSEELDLEGLLEIDRESLTFSHEGSKSMESKRRDDTVAVDPSVTRYSRFEDSEGLTLEGEHVVHTGRWRGNVSRARVWVGNGVPGPHPAVNAYMDLVRRASLRKVVGSASPAHVKAGAPLGSLLFLDAWQAILIPESMPSPPRGHLNGMKDIIGELKRYRMATRQAHMEEKRKVEVVVSDNASRASDYWR